MSLMHKLIRAVSGDRDAEGDDPLEAARRCWIAEKPDLPPLGEDWEERVMFAVRARPMRDPEVPNWLAERFRPLALANLAIILCALMLFWHAGDPTPALADYAQSVVSSYEVFF